jgi:hypothetical protein
MCESTVRESWPEPVDEAGVRLTGDELDAVERARPHLWLVVAGHLRDDVIVSPGGLQTMDRDDGGPGRVIVTRAVITDAMRPRRD